MEANMFFTNFVLMASTFLVILSFNVHVSAIYVTMDTKYALYRQHFPTLQGHFSFHRRVEPRKPPGGFFSNWSVGCHDNRSLCCADRCSRYGTVKGCHGNFYWQLDLEPSLLSVKMRLIRVKRRASSATATPASSTVTSVVSLSSGSAMAILGRLSSGTMLKKNYIWGYAIKKKVENLCGLDHSTTGVDPTIDARKAPKSSEVKLGGGCHPLHVPKFGSCHLGEGTGEERAKLKNMQGVPTPTEVLLRYFLEHKETVISSSQKRLVTHTVSKYVFGMQHVTWTRCPRTRGTGNIKGFLLCLEKRRESDKKTRINTETRFGGLMVQRALLAVD
uniref:Uncharacterized protein n=1 Tax=Timema douglasi TaxID=61478 RepID=A0A7R8Z555_TIMDO|nr:unnamed protein product [Timema douglasi]